MFYAYVIMDNSKQEELYVGSGSGNRYKDRGKHNKGLTEHLLTNKITPGVIIHQTVTKQEANEVEEDLILQFGRRDLGTGTLFNLTNGLGHKGSALKKESIAKREATKTLNGTHKGGRQKGFIVNQETKDKIAAANDGQKRSKERKLNMSIAAKSRLVFSCVCCHKEFKHARHFSACIGA